MSNLAELLALANAAAETGPDMNVAVKGGGGGRLLPEGYAFGTLVEYIEYGNQPQEYQGKAKEPALEFQLGFALMGDGYSNEDGTPYILRPWPMALSQNDKARAFLLFKALNWKGDKKHFAQLLGQKFLVKIVHTKPKDPAEKVRSQIDLKGFLPPLDPVTKMPYPIPDVDASLYKLFLWSHPDLTTFHSFYQEGEYEAKDGMPARSKNVVQEKMLGALDFEGSALQALLITNNVQYKVPVKVNVPKAAAPAAPSAAPAGPAPAAPSIPATPASAPAVAPAPASAPAAVATPAPAMPSAPAAAAVAAPSAPSAPAMPTMPTAPAMPAMPTAPAA